MIQALAEQVHPQDLMDAVQRVMVDGSRAWILSEGGNAMAWANHCLVFKEPYRYRSSQIQGSLGHCAAGVLGTALAIAPVPAVAVLGDGAMLYGHEMHTAVSERIDNAVWVVLNDGRYGSAHDGQASQGLSTGGLQFHRADFVGYARAMGADGVSVRSAGDLDAALRRALEVKGPLVVDVWVRSVPSPLTRRFASLVTPKTSAA